MSNRPECAYKGGFETQSLRPIAPALRPSRIGVLAAAWVLLGWQAVAEAQISVVAPATTGAIRVEDSERLFAQGFLLAFDPEALNAALSETAVAGLRLSIGGQPVRTVLPVAEGDVLVASTRHDANLSITHVETTAEGRNIFIEARDTRGRIHLTQSEVGVFNADRTPVCFALKDIADVDTQVLFDILIDRSGSMGPYIPAVKAAVERFFAALPANARCRVTSFNDRYRRHTSTYRPCDAREHGLDLLRAQGNTDIFYALDSVYDDHHVAGQRQRAVVVITDGMGQSDITKEQLRKKKNAPTFVYWLGDYDERRLAGLADAYIHGREEASATLRRYFQSIGEAVSGQQVLVTGARCDGHSARTQ